MWRIVWKRFEAREDVFEEGDEANTETCFVPVCGDLLEVDCCEGLLVWVMY